MSEINHERPVLKLIDDLKRRRASAGTSKLFKYHKKFDTQRAISRSATTLSLAEERAAIFEIARAAADHITTHRDATVLKGILSLPSREKDADALMKWFIDFGFATHKGNGNFGISRKIQPNHAAAFSTPYWKLGEGANKEPKGFDFRKEIAQLVGKATERLVAKKSGDVIDVKLLAAIKTLLNN